MIFKNFLKGSTNIEAHGADKCIDGITEVDTNYCDGKIDPAPWLAVDFGGEDKRVSIEKVVLFNREDCCWSTTKNIEIRLTNKKPTSAKGMFLGGDLLGTFEGAATRGEQVEIHSGPGWENKVGRFLIIQMNHGNEPQGISLKEVQAIGSSHAKTNTIEVASPGTAPSLFLALTGGVLAATYDAPDLFRLYHRGSSHPIISCCCLHVQQASSFCQQRKIGG